MPLLLGINKNIPPLDVSMYDIFIYLPGTRTDSYYQIGKFAIPVRIYEDAVEIHGYQNPPLKSMLENAFSSVFDIALGRRHHPVIEAFKAATKDRAGGNKAIFADNWSMKYSVPLLQGDLSLLDEFITTAHRTFRAHWESESETEPLLFDLDSLLHGPVRLLFDVVILRHYLERTPADDNQIFQLLFDAGESREMSPPKPPNLDLRPYQVYRKRTVPEQVLAACAGYKTTAGSVTFGESWVTVIASLKKSIKPEHAAVSFVPPLVYIKPPGDGAPHMWFPSKAQGLTGGTPYEEFVRNGNKDKSVPMKRVLPRPLHAKEKNGVAQQRAEEKGKGELRGDATMLEPKQKRSRQRAGSV